MFGNNKLTLEEIQKHIEDAYWERLDPPLNVWTGIEGALNFQQHVVESYGGTYTKEDREYRKTHPGLLSFMEDSNIILYPDKEFSIDSIVEIIKEINDSL